MLGTRRQRKPALADEHQTRMRSFTTMPGARRMQPAADREDGSAARLKGNRGAFRLAESSGSLVSIAVSY